MDDTKKTCAGQAWAPGAFRGHRCGVTAKYEHKGHWYCKTHHPPTVAEKRAARDALLTAEQDARNAAWQRQADAKRAMECEAKRWRFLVGHWYSLMDGIPLHRWLDEQALRHGGIGAALDYAISYHESAERHIAT